MINQNQKPTPKGKPVQSLILETAVFAAVFFTIIWLIEDHSAIAVVLGLAAIVYMVVKKKSG